MSHKNTIEEIAATGLLVFFEYPTFATSLYLELFNVYSIAHYGAGRVFYVLYDRFFYVFMAVLFLRFYFYVYDLYVVYVLWAMFSYFLRFIWPCSI